MITLREGAAGNIYGIEQEDQELPAGSIVVGNNGQFMVSQSPVFQYIKKMNGNTKTMFRPINEGVKVLSKIPWDVFWIAPRWIRNQWRGNWCKDSGRHIEFILLLFYDKEKGEYFWYPPEQKGTSAAVKYSPADDEKIAELVGKGFLLVGSMHNHFGQGTAYQSTTDERDESEHGMPMIHFTMGHMDAPWLECSEFDIRFVCGELSRKISFSEVIDEGEVVQPPKDWNERLKINYKHPKSSTSLQSWSGRGRPLGYKVNNNGRRSFYPGGGPGQDDYDIAQHGGILGLPAWDHDDWESYLEANEHGSEFTEEDYPDIYEDINEDIELECSGKVLEEGAKSDAFKSTIQKYGKLHQIAAGLEILMAKTVTFELLRDFQHILLGISGEAHGIGIEDPREVFTFMVEVMQTIGKIDDMLETFVKEQQKRIK